MNEIGQVPPESVSPELVPPAPAPEKRVWGGWATLGWGAVILAAFFIIQTIAIIIPLVVLAFLQIDVSPGAAPDDLVGRVMDILESNMGLLQSIATIVSGIISVGLIILIIRAKKGASIAEYLGLRKIGWKAALLSAGLIIAFNFLAGWIQVLLGNEAVDEQFLVDFYGTAVSPALFWISVVIFAPLFEEAFFRGFLFKGFSQSRLGVFWTIIITAAAWALLHAFQYHIFNILVILALGILMGVMRWKTRSIWAPFIMHAVMNLMAVIALELSLGM